MTNINDLPTCSPDCPTMSSSELEVEQKWRDLRNQAAIAAMQGALANCYLHHLSNSIPCNSIAKQSVLYADALIEALKKKYRFEYKGLINVEDLFDLKLEDLDYIYKNLKRNENDLQVDSLLDANKNPLKKEIENKINIVKAIIDMKDRKTCSMISMASISLPVIPMARQTPKSNPRSLMDVIQYIM